MLAVLKFSSFSCSFFLKIALADACLAFSQKALFVMSLLMMLSIYAGVVYLCWSCLYLELYISISGVVYLCLSLSMLSVSAVYVYLGDLSMMLSIYAGVYHVCRKFYHFWWNFIETSRSF